jgi:hypothetical protein
VAIGRRPQHGNEGDAMTAHQSALPETVRQSPLARKIKLLNSTDLAAFHVLVTSCSERSWRAEFHAGPRGGLKLKTQKKGEA